MLPVSFRSKDGITRTSLAILILEGEGWQMRAPTSAARLCQ